MMPDKGMIRPSCIASLLPPISPAVRRPSSFPWFASDQMIILKRSALYQREYLMARDHLLVIDQGTTSTRAVLYNARLQPAGQGQTEVLPSYPRSGWVEHDADALIASVGSQVTLALLDAGVKADRIAAIGLTNQRETTIVWERATGRPIAPALVWQDRRTAAICD